MASPAPRHEAPAEQRDGDRDHGVADLDRDLDGTGTAEEERRQHEQDERQERGHAAPSGWRRGRLAQGAATVA